MHTPVLWKSRTRPDRLVWNCSGIFQGRSPRLSSNHNYLLVNSQARNRNRDQVSRTWKKKKIQTSAGARDLLGRSLLASATRPERIHMARVYIGTSGWNYKHWSNGEFYPEDVKPPD